MSNPGRAIFLHVGARKTGTSFLQRVIYTAPQTVTEQGVELPLKGRIPHLRLLQTLGVLEDAELPADEAAALLRRFSRGLSSVKSGRSALITHEDLAAAEPEQVDRLLTLLDGFEVHILVTARDLGRQIPSEWQQCVKSRMQATYGEFLDAVVARRGPDSALFWARQDVADVAGRWGRSLPPDQVHIVTVPRSGSSMALLPERFWTVMGVNPPAGDVSGGRNPSLGAQQAELLRRVNVALGDRLTDVRNDYRPVVKMLVRQVLNAQSGTPLRLPERLVPWCTDVSKRIVEEIRDRGYDVVGDLDDLMPAADVAAAEEDSGLTVADAAVAQTAVEALATLLQHQRDGLHRAPGRFEGANSEAGSDSAGQQRASRWKRAVGTLRGDEGA